MVLHILRALFVLLMGGIGWFFVGDKSQPLGDQTGLAMATTVTMALFFVAVDILSPRRKLAIFSGTFLGLIVGLLVCFAMSFVVELLVDQYLPVPTEGRSAEQIRLLNEHRAAVKQFINVVLGTVSCYLAISFVLQTKDDFRFIVPYVEFSKQVRGARPVVVDTSVIIDGRILDLADTGVFDGRLIVPRFVLNELQTLADSADKLKRNRGRRGLDVLNKLQGNRRVEVILYEWTGHSSPEAQGADQKLLVLAKELHGRVLTSDTNLSKVAQVQGVDVVNLNDLSKAMRPVVLPGEKLMVRLVKPGEEPTQGVGFLEDGTMVVVEQGRGHINTDLEIVVTNMLTTAAGRIVFGRVSDAAARRIESERTPAAT